ncbi:MAG: GNAT family N-acetyltransferase [bacterium]|nr:GNAT family N-acetyltransferase [bacterium]
MIAIRRATAADAGQLVTGLAPLYRRPLGSETQLASALRNEDFILLLAMANAHPIGYLQGQLLDRLDGQRMMLIYDLEVAEDERRRGTATALLEHCLDLAAQHGTSRTWLISDPQNEPARSLYIARGGTEWPAVGFEFGERAN